MEIFEEEKKYLDVTLDVIDKEIKKAKEALEKAILSGRKLSYFRRWMPCYREYGSGCKRRELVNAVA